MEEVNDISLEKEINVSRRQATEMDTEFARSVHHSAYHDVIVKQFGVFDEKIQDDFFFKSWKPEKYEIIVNDTIDVGCCSIERVSDYIFLSDFILIPSAQGKRIGTKILEELIEESKTKGVPIKLQVLKENQAQYLYRKMGFKDIGTTDTHIKMEFNPNQ